MWDNYTSPASALSTNWLEANRYLNMSELKEMKKTELRQAA